jgi:hypothetical protein
VCLGVLKEEYCVVEAHRVQSRLFFARAYHRINRIFKNK